LSDLMKMHVKVAFMKKMIILFNVWKGMKESYVMNELLLVQLSTKE
jgi:hypothetical protein